ncbi:MarR family winged helix-turn-helix transcriptional regulator [Cetobacterium sp. SF1]|uniref:MarR family winged helix-turn-helix transcriptional regulator n=1 Tax=unclassified Cetobacterium TaxID=2630983 RepID=UPI003CF83A95
MANLKKGLVRNLLFFSNFLTEKIQDVVNEFHLTHSEYLILRYILDFESTTQYDIAKKLHISTQRCNQITKILSEKNYITKQNSLKGKLIKKELFITPQGKNLLNEISKKLFENFQKEPIPNEELIILNLTLQKLNNFIQKN